MNGRAFLEVARELALGATEAHWRSAVGRAYYALMLEGRDALLRWGFRILPRDQVHAFVRLRFWYGTDFDLKEVGYALDRLVALRNRPDYQLAPSPLFASARQAQAAVADAGQALARLDQVEGNAPRLAAASAGIRAAFP
jgi:hypothetical protein